MGTESFRRGLIFILLIFALVLSMSFTAAPVLAPGVSDEPGGDIIEVGPGQEFTLRFRLRWDIPGELGYFSFFICWDSPGENGTPSENFTFLGAEAYFDNLDQIDITLDFYEAAMDMRRSYGIIVYHYPGDQRDGEFNVDLRFRAVDAGGVPHAPTDNHPIVISDTIDVPEGPIPYSYPLPDPYITIRVAGWRLIEMWTRVVEAPAGWQLIETWTGTVEAPAEWQLIEMWTGVVEAPAEWQLIETWIGTVSAPAAWQLVETWTGTVEAPAVWQLIEIWTGTVEAPDAQAPPVPTLVSPADGTTTDDTTPTFDWSDVTDPSGVTYTLEIIGTLTKTGLTTSTYTLTLSDGNYSWRVRAIDNVGNESDWSGTWSLTVSTAPPPPPPPVEDNVPPPAPSLISPADGENITDNTPSLDWSDVSDPSAVTYDLSIARDAGFTSIVIQKTNLTASAYELTSDDALAVDIYYWRVRGVDGAGNVGSWSENWSFTNTEIPTGLIENESPPVDIPSITTDENATIDVENTAITGMTIVVGENVENVRITVQQLTDKPAEIAIGAPGVTYTYLNIISENITDADIDIVLINFEVEKAWITAEDIDPDSIVMQRWDLVAEVWVSLPTTRIGDDNTYYYYYQAESPGLSIFGIGYALAPAPAEFEFSNLVIEPSEVRAGKTVTISVVVAHVGDLGSYNVILKIDNVVEAAESVTLAGVATETVTFTVSSDAEGTHDIEVEGLAGTFVVTPSAPPSIVPLAITGGIVLLAGILIWLRRRRNPIAGGYPSTNGAS